MKGHQCSFIASRRFGDRFDSRLGLGRQVRRSLQPHAYRQLGGRSQAVYEALCARLRVSKPMTRPTMSDANSPLKDRCHTETRVF